MNLLSVLSVNLFIDSFIDSSPYRKTMANQIILLILSCFFFVERLKLLSLDQKDFNFVYIGLFRNCNWGKIEHVL